MRCSMSHIFTRVVLYQCYEMVHRDGNCVFCAKSCCTIQHLKLRTEHITMQVSWIVRMPYPYHAYVTMPIDGLLECYPVDNSEPDDGIFEPQTEAVYYTDRHRVRRHVDPIKYGDRQYTLRCQGMRILLVDCINDTIYAQAQLPIEKYCSLTCLYWDMSTAIAVHGPLVVKLTIDWTKVK